MSKPNLITFNDLLSKGSSFQYPVPIAQIENAESILQRQGRTFKLYRPPDVDFVWVNVEARAA